VRFVFAGRKLMLFTIRDLKNYDEMLEVHRLQQEIWGLDNPAFGIYPPLMNTAAKNGGIVLGAFDIDSDKMVAFLFSFIGREGNGPYKLCSQTMGVLKEWRRYGIAEALKRAQRQQAMAQGLPLITWTFDPLEGPNAHLNLHKLRAVSRRYWPDVYGSNFGALNAGLPTDRLLVEWWVEGLRINAPTPTGILDAPSIFEVVGHGIERRIETVHFDFDANSLWLEIPGDIHPVKAANMDVALDWRLKVRAAFETYFERGYIATDFVSQVDPQSGERCNRYLLQKATPALLDEIGIHHNF